MNEYASKLPFEFSFKNANAAISRSVVYVQRLLAMKLWWFGPMNVSG